MVKWTFPIRSRLNPVIGPVRDLTGHSGHARSNPVRAPAGAAIWVGRGEHEAFFFCVVEQPRVPTDFGVAAY